MVAYFDLFFRPKWSKTRSKFTITANRFQQCSAFSTCMLFFNLSASISVMDPLGCCCSDDSYCHLIMKQEVSLLVSYQWVMLLHSSVDKECLYIVPLLPRSSWVSKHLGASSSTTSISKNIGISSLWVLKDVGTYFWIHMHQRVLAFLESQLVILYNIITRK